MAKHDALDLVLRNIDKRDDWLTIAKVADCYELMKYYLDNKKMVEEFNREIRSNFGHTLVNLFRGNYDPDYVEILCEVADKLKIPCKYRKPGESSPWWDCYYKKDVVDRCEVHNNPDIEQIEDLIIIKYFELVKESVIKEKGSDAWKNVEVEMRTNINKLHSEGKISDHDFAKLGVATKGSIGLSTLVMSGELSGFAIYKLATVALFAVSRVMGMSLAVAGAGATLSSALSIALGPLGWGLTVFGLLVSLGGTSWKKTIPTVFVIACLRKQQIYGEEEEKPSDSNDDIPFEDYSWKKITLKKVSEGQVSDDEMDKSVSSKRTPLQPITGGSDEFNKLMEAAVKGDTTAMYNMGKVFEYGLLGKEKDYLAARRWYKNAAGKGLVVAQYKWEDIDRLINKEKESKEFKEKFRTDPDEAEQLYNEGWRYEHGVGVPVNIEHAKELYRKAAFKGHQLAKSRLNYLASIS